jgi:ABC-2 type transport system ATP-binding protein
VPEKRIDAVLDLVGLLGRGKDRVRTYSLGMKQRLGIAIALLQDPDLLILDEPTNGMDPAGIVEMRELLHRLVDGGKTVFVSSHLLAEVQQICTRVAIINFGKLVTESTVAELTSGRGEFRVIVENAPTVLELVRNYTWGQDARMDGEDALLTRSEDGTGRALNRFLFEAGYIPERLELPSTDLEAVFLNLTHGGTGDTK